jgi:hypothetical protein
MIADIVTNLLAGVGASSIFNAIASTFLGGIALMQPTVLIGLFLGFTIVPLMREVLKPEPSPFYYSHPFN